MRSGLVHEGEEETSAEPAEVHAASRGAFELRSAFVRVRIEERVRACA